MITEEQLAKEREVIPFTSTKRLKRDDILYVTEKDIPHPIYGYAKYHKEYSVIDLRGYRKGYEPRLEISGPYTPNPEDIFRLQTGKLPPYQPTTTGDKLLAEMRRLGVHKAFRIDKPSPVEEIKERGNPIPEEVPLQVRKVQSMIERVPRDYDGHFIDYGDLRWRDFAGNQTDLVETPDGRIVSVGEIDGKKIYILRLESWDDFEILRTREEVIETLKWGLKGKEITEANPPAVGDNPEDARLLKVAIEREPLRVAKQWGYEVHRLSPKDIVDKDDYARGYRYRLSKADPAQPYPRIVMARNEGEVAAFLKKKIEGNPDTGTSIIDLRGNYDEIAHVKDGILYRKGNIVQVWWDKWGKETWTGPSEEQARENFNAMKERWSSSELGNPVPEELDLAKTLAIIDSRPKAKIIESKLREEFGDAVIDALRQGHYVVSGSAGYNPPLLVSLKGRELIQGGNPTGKVITEEEAIGLLERLSMTPGEAARSLVADEAERREIMRTVQQRVKREQNKWAPMDPREGPPLPRIFAGLRWPWKK